MASFRSRSASLPHNSSVSLRCGESWAPCSHLLQDDQEPPVTAHSQPRTHSPTAPCHLDSDFPGHVPIPPSSSLAPVKSQARSPGLWHMFPPRTPAGYQHNLSPSSTAAKPQLPRCRNSWEQGHSWAKTQPSSRDRDKGCPASGPIFGAAAWRLPWTGLCPRPARPGPAGAPPHPAFLGTSWRIARGARAPGSSLHHLLGVHAHTAVLGAVRARDLSFTARILLFVTVCLDTAETSTSIWNVCSSLPSLSEYKAGPLASLTGCV